MNLFWEVGLEKYMNVIYLKYIIREIDIVYIFSFVFLLIFRVIR